MKTALAFLAAAAFVLSLAGTADAQKIDKNGRCHAANGQFAKAEVCGGVSKTTTKASTKTTAAAPPAAAVAPAKGVRCKNDKGKFAKCGTAGAHPA